MRRQGERRGLLVDGHAESFGDVGQAARQARRVETGAVRRVHRSQAAFDADALGGLVRREVGVVGLAETPFALVLDLLQQTGDLGLAGRQRERAALVVTGVDAFVGDHPADLVDGREHGALHGDRRVATELVGNRARRGGKEARAPAAVAPRGAEPGDLLLEDGDAQRGVGFLQVIGRPQTREAGAGDGHVDVDGTGQRGAWGELAGYAVEPQRAGTVVGHVRLLGGWRHPTKGVRGKSAKA